MTFGAAADAFVRSGNGWSSARFFSDGRASVTAAELDRRAALGAAVLPLQQAVFRALELTAPGSVRAVILGQDPYPTPGDADGLAFSYSGQGRLPRSLLNIHRELESDLGFPAPDHGRLDAWAQSGALLLNTVLTVEAGLSGAHRGLGWEALTDEIICMVSRQARPAVFILWGNDAQKKRGLIDEGRHGVIASAHPSPLSASRGFFGSKPFSRANSFLKAAGSAPVDWRLR